VRTRRVAPAVLGLDLSLKRSAACFIPAGWELGEWGDLTFASFPTPDVVPNLSVEEAQVARMKRIDHVAERVVDFATNRCEPTHVRVEEFGFSKHSTSVTALGELRGVVRREVWRATGKMMVPITVSAARRLLLGHLPRKDAKVLVQQALYKHGAPFDDDDQCDAFCVANAGLAELGLIAVTLATRLAG